MNEEYNHAGCQRFARIIAITVLLIVAAIVILCVGESI